MIDDALADAYLGRLGVRREPPSIDALRRLHRAHVERVPYETVWLHLGEAWTINPRAALERIAHHQRGGYCFHLNGAFSELLASLGYRVSRHVGAVHGPDGPTPDLVANHLALVVEDLPDGNGNSSWHVDAGLGDALHEPLPLATGAYTQGPLRLVIDNTADAHWRMTHDPELGSFTAMTFAAEPCAMDAFAAKHAWLSTDPQSRFVRTLTVQRRDANGADVLRGLMLRRVGTDMPDVELATSADFFTVLADMFALPLDTTPRTAREELWRKLAVAHEAWCNGSGH